MRLINEVIRKRKVKNMLPNSAQSPYVTCVRRERPHECLSPIRICFSEYVRPLNSTRVSPALSE